MSNRKVLVTETNLEDIATAIRARRKVSDSYYPREMAEAIMGIEGDEPELEAISIVANGTYRPSGGVDGFNVVFAEVPTLEAVITDDAIVLTGDAASVSDDAVVIGSGEYIHKRVTENGTYQAADDGVSGYSGVTVDVAKNVREKVITVSGDYDAAVDGLDGYSRVSVRVGNVIWSAEAIVDGEYPFAAVESALNLGDMTFFVEAEEATLPRAEVEAAFALNTLIWTAEAREEE